MTPARSPQANQSQSATSFVQISIRWRSKFRHYVDKALVTKASAEPRTAVSMKRYPTRIYLGTFKLAQRHSNNREARLIVTSHTQ